MTIKLEVIEPEKCAICGKAIGRGRTAVVFFFNGKKPSGAWHAKCGPLPYIEGLTVPVPK